MSKIKAIRTAVVGIGKLGRFHAQKHLQLQKSLGLNQLVGIYDANNELAKKVAQELKQEFQADLIVFDHLNEIYEQVDMVTLATPSSTHVALALEFLSKGIHCFVEKPLSLNLSGALELVELAKSQNCFLGVGQSERYNPAYLELKKLINSPKYIQFLRHSPFAPRVTDVTVVDDLMIHDLDLLWDWTHQDFKFDNVQGGQVRSDKWDWVTAGATLAVPLTGTGSNIDTARRTHFVKASLSSQRLGPSMDRLIRAYSDGISVLADLQNLKISVTHWDQSGIDISTEHYSLDRQDHLLLETQDFFKHIQGQAQYSCLGLDVLRSLEWRDKILDQLSKQNLSGSDFQGSDLEGSDLQGSDLLGANHLLGLNKTNQ